jgi:hypothetical protein
VRILKVIIDFYIRASIHVAFAIYALVRVTVLSLQLPTNGTIATTVFLEQL